MTNLTEKAAILSFSTILMRVSVIFSGILVVRLLSQEQLGSFRQVHLIFSTCTLVLLFGIPSSIYFFVPKADDHEKRGIIFQTYLTLFIIGALGGMIIYIYAPAFSLQFNNIELTALIQRYSPYLAFSLPGTAFFAAMMSLNKIVRASFIRFGITITEIAAFLIPILLQCRLITIFTTMLIVNSVMAIITIGYSLKVSPKGNLFPARGFGLQQIRFSLPLGIGQMTGLLSKEVDKIFISMFFSVKQFAAYSVGAIELPINDFFASSIRTILLPEFAKNFQKNNKEEIVSTWKESRRKLAIISFPIVSLFFFISPELLTFVYGEQYYEAVPIFQIYLFIPLLSNIESSFILHANGKTRLILYASLVNFSVNMVFNYIFIQLIGTNGPPIATVLAQLLSSWIAIRWVNKELNLEGLRLFPLREYGKILGICILAGCPIIFLRFAAILTSKLYFLVVSGICFGSIICIMYFMFVLKREDLQLLQTHLARITVLNSLLCRYINKY